MDDDIRAGDQLVDRDPIEHVTAAVLDLAQPVGPGVERPPRHRHDPLDLLRAVQAPEQRAPDVAGRARDGDR
jgi:hypothetical protein